MTLVAQTASEIDAGAAAIPAGGGTAHAAVFDVADLDAVAAFFAGKQAFDIRVNTAGTNRLKPMTKVTTEDHHAVLDLT